MSGAPGSSPAARHTIVKVCGLTRPEDAAWAIQCGADWLGFIVGAGGPRAIEPARAAEILASLPAGTVGVAVLAETGPDAALELARRSGAARLQLHRCDPAAWPAGYPVPCAFVTSVDAQGRARGPLAPAPHLPHLDTAHATLDGGTGLVFPWEHARALVGERAFLLAGGLGPDNVAAALAMARPFGVDASSRLESSPGIKDHDQVRRFVAAVRESDARDGATA